MGTLGEALRVGDFFLFFLFFFDPGQCDGQCDDPEHAASYDFPLH